MKSYALARYTLTPFFVVVVLGGLNAQSILAQTAFAQTATKAPHLESTPISSRKWQNRRRFWPIIRNFVNPSSTPHTMKPRLLWWMNGPT